MFDSVLGGVLIIGGLAAGTCLLAWLSGRGMMH